MGSDPLSWNREQLCRTAPLKIHLMGYNSVADRIWVCLCSFSRCYSFPKWPIGHTVSSAWGRVKPDSIDSRCCIPKSRNHAEIRQNLPYSISRSSKPPRSSILVSIESACAYATSGWSLTVTLGYTVFEIFTFKARKWLSFSTPSLFDTLTHSLGEPIRIFRWNLPRKN